MLRVPLLRLHDLRLQGRQVARRDRSGPDAVRHEGDRLDRQADLKQPERAAEERLLAVDAVRHHRRARRRKTVQLERRELTRDESAQLQHTAGAYMQRYGYPS